MYRFVNVNQEYFVYKLSNMQWEYKNFQFDDDKLMIEFLK